MVLYPKDHGLELLNTIREKIQLLDEAGVEHLIIHPFDREFSELSSEDFIREVIVKKLKTAYEKYSKEVGVIIPRGNVFAETVKNVLPPLCRN